MGNRSIRKGEDSFFELREFNFLGILSFRAFSISSMSVHAAVLFTPFHPLTTLALFLQFLILRLSFSHSHPQSSSIHSLASTFRLFFTQCFILSASLSKLTMPFVSRPKSSFFLLSASVSFSYQLVVHFLVI